MNYLKKLNHLKTFHNNVLIVYVIIFALLCFIVSLFFISNDWWWRTVTALMGAMGATIAVLLTDYFNSNRSALEQKKIQLSEQAKESTLVENYKKTIIKEMQLLYNLYMDAAGNEFQKIGSLNASSLSFRYYDIQFMHRNDFYKGNADKLIKLATVESEAIMNFYMRATAIHKAVDRVVRLYERMNIFRQENYDRISGDDTHRMSNPIEMQAALLARKQEISLHRSGLNLLKDIVKTEHKNFCLAFDAVRSLMIS